MSVQRCNMTRKSFFLLAPEAAMACLLVGCPRPPEELVPIEEVLINAAGDSFVIGDSAWGPGVTQSFSYNFHIGKYEITNEQYDQLVRDGGYDDETYWTTHGWLQKTASNWTSAQNTADASQPQMPAVVSWYETVAFCNWRSVKEVLQPAYDELGQADLGASGYRLATTVEWEYVAAKGAPSAPERSFPWGDTWDEARVVGLLLPLADVGSKSPGGDTPQGIADMAGNLYEWCSDNEQRSGVEGLTDRYYFLSDAATEKLLIRGGAYYNDAPNPYASVFPCSWAAGVAPYSRDSGLDAVGIRTVRQ
jgi:formylglycine-generating enzyme required for sulfatase activity